MYIAIYHNQDIHHEMLGYLIDFCGAHNYKADVYWAEYDDTKLNESGESWIKWYNLYFKGVRNIELVNSERLLHENYDIIFLVTDDNIFYARYIPEKLYRKTISIEHWLKTRNILKHKIAVRPYSDGRPVAYPVYDIITIDQKLKVMNRERIQLFLIGRFNAPTSHNLLLFEDVDNIDIHYINWEIKDKCKYLQKLPNLYFHEKMSTCDLMSLLSTGHYIYIEPSYAEGYNGNKLSSLIPLSLSTLCQCIIPESWNNSLNLITPMLYNDKEYLSPQGQIKLSLKKFYKILPEIEMEKQKLIKNRNDTFRQVINAVLEESKDA